jgi:hypothetical protein
MHKKKSGCASGVRSPPPKRAKVEGKVTSFACGRRARYGVGRHWSAACGVWWRGCRYLGAFCRISARFRLCATIVANRMAAVLSGGSAPSEAAPAGASRWRPSSWTSNRLCDYAPDVAFRLSRPCTPGWAVFQTRLAYGRASSSHFGLQPVLSGGIGVAHENRRLSRDSLVRGAV